MSGFKVVPSPTGWVDFEEGVAGEEAVSLPLLVSVLARQPQAIRVVATQTMRTVSETQGSIQVLMHDHLAARQRHSPAHPPAICKLRF